MPINQLQNIFDLSTLYYRYPSFHKWVYRQDVHETLYNLQDTKVQA